MQMKLASLGGEEIKSITPGSIGDEADLRKLIDGPQTAATRNRQQQHVSGTGPAIFTIAVWQPSGFVPIAEKIRQNIAKKSNLYKDTDLYLLLMDGVQAPGQADMMELGAMFFRSVKIYKTHDHNGRSASSKAMYQFVAFVGERAETPAVMFLRDMPSGPDFMDRAKDAYRVASAKRIPFVGYTINEPGKPVQFGSNIIAPKDWAYRKDSPLMVQGFAAGVQQPFMRFLSPELASLTMRSDIFDELRPKGATNEVTDPVAAAEIVRLTNELANLRAMEENRTQLADHRTQAPIPMPTLPPAPHPSLETVAKVEEVKVVDPDPIKTYTLEQAVEIVTARGLREASVNTNVLDLIQEKEENYKPLALAHQKFLRARDGVPAKKEAAAKKEKS